MEQLLLFGNDEEYDPDRGPRRSFTRRVSRQERAFEAMLEMVSDPQMRLFVTSHECSGCGKKASFEFLTDSGGWIRFEITGTVKKTGFVCSVKCLDISGEKRSGRPDNRKTVPLGDSELDTLLEIF